MSIEIPTPGAQTRRPARVIAAAVPLLIVTLLQACAASADEQAGSSFGADDPSVVPCELLVKMYERAPTGTERQFYNWAQGYFAGRSADDNFAARRILPASGEARQQSFGKMLTFCRTKPASTFGEAVLALWQGGR